MSTLRLIAQPSPRGLQHLAAAIDGDDPARRTAPPLRWSGPCRSRDRRRPSADRTAPGSACSAERAAEQLAAQAIPLPRRRRRRTPRTCVCRRASTPFEPPRVLIRPGVTSRPAREAAPTAAGSARRARRAPACSSGSCHRAATRPSRRRPASSRWRLTVDCGSCSTAQSSDTVSS